MQESPKLRRLTTPIGLSALVCRGAVIALLLLLNHLEPVDGQFVSPFAEYSQNQPILILADAAAREALHIRRIDSSGVAIDEVTMLDGSSKEIYFADSAGNMPLRELVFYVGKKSDGSKMLNLETIYSPIDGGILKEFTYSPSGQLRGTGVVYPTDESVQKATGEKLRFRREYLDMQGRLAKVTESTLKGAVARSVLYSANGVRLYQRDNFLAAPGSWAAYHYFADGITVKRREVRSYAYYEVDDFYQDGLTVSCHSQVYQWRNNLTCYRPDGTYEYMITKVRTANLLEVSTFDSGGRLKLKRSFRMHAVDLSGKIMTAYKLVEVRVYTYRHDIEGITVYELNDDGAIQEASTNGQIFVSGLKSASAEWLKIPESLTFAAESEASKVDSETALQGHI